MRVADIFNYSAVFGSVGVLVVKDVSVKRGCRLVARAGERARAHVSAFIEPSHSHVLCCCLHVKRFR